jgi:hypothetical protein
MLGCTVQAVDRRCDRPCHDDARHQRYDFNDRKTAPTISAVAAAPRYYLEWTEKSPVQERRPRAERCDYLRRVLLPRLLVKIQHVRSTIPVISLSKDSPPGTGIPRVPLAAQYRAPRANRTGPSD